ncbi:MAG: DUF2911 domain-containing protein [Gemmatimonadales bacterium]
MRHLFVPGLLLLAILPTPGVAQIRASERAQLAQTIDGTTLSLDFARPRVRGRDSIFGGQVFWTEVWTPGANMATTLEVNRDIQIDGHPVPKGKYSVWMVVVPGDQWTFVLDTVWNLYHEARPKERPGQIRFPITPVAAPLTEVLTWSFPEVTATGAQLRMAWADRVVNLRVTVEPRYALTLPATEAAPYLGSYLVTWTSSGGDPDKPATLKVVSEHGGLAGYWTPELWEELDRVLMIRIASDWMVMGFTSDSGTATGNGSGEVLDDIFMEMVFEFSTPVNGHSERIELRGRKDRLLGTAKRVK